MEKERAYGAEESADNGIRKALVTADVQTREPSETKSLGCSFIHGRRFVHAQQGNLTLSYTVSWPVPLSK